MQLMHSSRKGSPCSQQPLAVKQQRIRWRWRAASNVLPMCPKHEDGSTSGWTVCERDFALFTFLTKLREFLFWPSLQNSQGERHVAHVDRSPARSEILVVFLGLTPDSIRRGQCACALSSGRKCFRSVFAIWNVEHRKYVARFSQIWCLSPSVAGSEF